MNIEYVAAGKDFVGTVIFPNQKKWQELDVLYIGDNEPRKGLEILHSQFPQSHIYATDVAVFLTPNLLPSDKRYDQRRYDYIYVEPTVGKMYGATMFLELHRLLSLLKPDGVICSVVYGYAGYYGLEMLRTIVKRFIANEDVFFKYDHINEEVAIDKELAVARALVANLPANHPAYRQKQFMERLLNGNMDAYRELYTVSADNVFTVSLLLEHIARNGGRFLGWVHPDWYEPGLHIREKSILEKLVHLPYPQRWEVAELVNAAPDEHSFLLAAPHCP